MRSTSKNLKKNCTQKRKSKKMTVISKICLSCGKEFTPHSARQRVCDVFCRAAYDYKHRAELKAKRMKKYYRNRKK